MSADATENGTEALPPELAAWVETTTGGRIQAARRHAGGASRIAWSLDVAGGGPAPEALFLMRDKGRSAGSQRDAVILEGLAPTPIPVPRVVGRSPELGAVLLERLPGRSDFPAVDDEAEREPTARHLMQLAATLHAIDPATLTIPVLRPPESAAALARSQLDPMDAALGQLGDAADPLFGFALAWLRRSAPQGDRSWLRRKAPRGDRAWSLVHSDLGPGNFLYAGGRVTGIVDWAVAHLGDPMEDLAALSIRDMATPIGSLARRFREYEEAGGGPIDPGRVAYYRVLVGTRNSLLIRLGLASPPADYDVGAMTAYALLLMRAAALALCDALGVARPEPEAVRSEAAEPTAAAERERREIEALLGTPSASLAEAEAALRSRVARAARAGDGTLDAQLAPVLARRMMHRAERQRETMGPLADRLPQPLPGATPAEPRATREDA